MSNRKLGWGLYIFIVIILIASVAVLVSAWGVGKSLVIFGAVGIVTLINWRAKKKKAQEQAREEEPKKLEEEQARSKIVLVEAVTDLADKAPIALGERADAGPPVDRNRFNDAEWETLLYTPQWVFIAVGVVDKTVGSHEQTQAMIRELGAPEHYDSPLFGQVLKAWCADMNSILERWKADSRKIPEGLRDTRRLLDAKLAPDSAKAFKECLFNLGRAIAEAGGEGAPGGGVLQMPKVSFDEQDVLIDISIMLGLRESVRPLSPWVNSMIAALDERAGPSAEKVLHQTPTGGQSSTQSSGSETQSAELSSSEPKKVPLSELAPCPSPAALEPAAPLAPPSLPTALQTRTSPESPVRRAAELSPSLPKKDTLTEHSPPPMPAVSAASDPPPGIALSPKQAAAMKEEKAPSSLAQQGANPKLLIIFGSLAAVVLLGVVGYFVFRPKPHARAFSASTLSRHVAPAGWKTYVSTKEKFSSDLQPHFVAFSFDYPASFVAAAHPEGYFVRLYKYAANGTDVMERFDVAWYNATTDTDKGRERLLDDDGKRWAKMYSEFNCKELARIQLGQGEIGGGRLWELSERNRNAHFIAGIKTILTHPPGNPRGVSIDLLGHWSDPKLKSATDVGVNDDLAAILRSFKFL